MTAQQDHQRLMDLLHINSLRQGADPNHPGVENAVNYDESKANPYPKLPDPLVLKTGKGDHGESVVEQAPPGNRGRLRRKFMAASRR